MACKHIFIVNGSPDFLDLLRELFQEENYNVTTTNFVPRTFDQIEVLQPDVVIVDLVVGERSGWNLLEQVTAGVRTSGIPMVVVSTSQQILNATQADASRFGGDRFLIKPLDLDDLLRAVDELIGQA